MEERAGWTFLTENLLLEIDCLRIGGAGLFVSLGGPGSTPLNPIVFLLIEVAVC
jgi:hypothetical protein